MVDGFLHGVAYGRTLSWIGSAFRLLRPSFARKRCCACRSQHSFDCTTTRQTVVSGWQDAGFWVVCAVILWPMFRTSRIFRDAHNITFWNSYFKFPYSGYSAILYSPVFDKVSSCPFKCKPFIERPSANQGWWGEEGALAFKNVSYLRFVKGNMGPMYRFAMTILSINKWSSLSAVHVPPW